MVSVVSAGITGYLVSRGGGIADAGYTATLQKVEGTTAIVSVQTPTGDTELVRVVEGGTAKVRDATISASSLTRGTLFTRGKAEVGIEVKRGPTFAGSSVCIDADSDGYGIGTNLADCPGSTTLTDCDDTLVGIYPGAVEICGNNIDEDCTGADLVCGSSTGHTHLSDFYTETLEFEVIKYAQLPNLSQSFSVLTSNPTNPNSYAESSHSMFTTIRVKEVDAMVYCKDGDVALGGGYFVNKKYPNDPTLGIQSHIYRAQTQQNQYLNTGGYSFSFKEPWDNYYDGQNYFDENGIIQGEISVNCARIEPTLHQFSQDY